MTARKFPADWPAIRFAVFKRDAFTCQYCMRVPPDGFWLEPDHIIPRSWGGSDHPANLLTACNGCNFSKGAKCGVPDGMLLVPEPDREGFLTWKRWGKWHLQFADDGDGSVLVFCPGTFGEYGFSVLRVHEPDWESHLRRKTWMHTERYSHPLRPGVAARVECKPGPMSFAELCDYCDREDTLFRQQEPSIPDKLAWEFRNPAGQQYYDFLDALAFCRLLVAPRTTETGGAP